MAQTAHKASVKDSIINKRSIAFAGLIQTRYTYSLTNQIDVNGKHFVDTVNGNVNSFSLKRVRFQVRTSVNAHFDAMILVNFAEFSNMAVSGKVLENAFIRYTLNAHFKIMAGQFRPFIGIEDAVPVDLIPSLDFTNQYYLFGANGWQSFQTGLSILGRLTREDKLPVHYYVGVHNGNGKTQPADNDNSKHIYARFDATFSKETTVGINAGMGSVQNKQGYMFGADVRSFFKLAPNWKLSIAAEYKEGTNFSAYNSYAVKPTPSLDQFRMRGGYVFPNLKYEYNHTWVKAFELSGRYEYLESNYRINFNPRHTIIPMLGIEFSEPYYAVLQAGVWMDLYKQNVPFTTQYSHNTAIVQMQIRF